MPMHQADAMKEADATWLIESAYIQWAAAEPKG